MVKPISLRNTEKKNRLIICCRDIVSYASNITEECASVLLFLPTIHNVDVEYNSVSLYF